MTTSSLDTIERILSICPRVHIYNIPPLTSNKGHNAASWTADPARQIFTARLRVLESATPNLIPGSSESNDDIPETITIKILLEDPATGALFAEAPYTNPSVVEAAQDSSRFFAVRVVSSSPPSNDSSSGGGGGSKGRQMTATLGIGFEDRSDAVDFGICLQEARKVLRFDADSSTPAGGKNTGPGGGTRGKKEPGGTSTSAGKRDWSLKEGETIKIDVGSRTAGAGERRRIATKGQPITTNNNDNSNKNTDDAKAQTALFSIKPPPPPAASAPAGSGAGSIPLLAPPPPPPSLSTASEARAERRRSREVPAVMMQKEKEKAAAAGGGFDDGEFGEFQ